MSAPLIGVILSICGGTASNNVPAKAEAVILCAKTGERQVVEGEGISGHAAFPEGTKNAVHELSTKLLAHPLSEKERKAVKFMADLTADGYGKGIGIDCEDDISGQLTCNTGVVSMEDGRIMLDMDIRYPISISLASVIEKLGKIADEAGFSQELIRDDPPGYMPGAHWLVELLSEAYTEETGDNKSAYVMGGGTYARKIKNAVGFGPGFDTNLSGCGLKKGHGGCHCADEAQSVTNLQRAVKIYVNALIKINERFEEENKSGASRRE